MRFESPFQPKLLSDSMLIICTDALTALRGASAFRDMKIIPIPISSQVLPEDFRAGICDPASTALLSEQLASYRGSPFPSTHCKSLIQNTGLGTSEPINSVL